MDLIPYPCSDYSGQIVEASNLQKQSRFSFNRKKAIEYVVHNYMYQGGFIHISSCLLLAYIPLTFY